jgi:hypothetical protein
VALIRARRPGAAGAPGTAKDGAGAQRAGARAARMQKQGKRRGAGRARAPVLGRRGVASARGRPRGPRDMGRRGPNGSWGPGAGPGPPARGDGAPTEAGEERAARVAGRCAGSQLLGGRRKAGRACGAGAHAVCASHTRAGEGNNERHGDRVWGRGFGKPRGRHRRWCGRRPCARPGRGALIGAARGERARASRATRGRAARAAASASLGHGRRAPAVGRPSSCGRGAARPVHIASTAGSASPPPGAPLRPDSSRAFLSTSQVKSTGGSILARSWGCGGGGGAWHGSGGALS